MLGTAPPLSNSWIISIIGLYIALNRTLNINCYWGGAVPNINARNLEPMYRSFLKSMVQLESRTVLFIIM